jgi:ankyrin repeat protein
LCVMGIRKWGIRIWITLVMATGALAAFSATADLLHDAARDGNLSQVKILLKQGADVNKRTEAGETPLHWAALGGHTAVVNELLKSGADVNAQNGFGSTPLHWAAGGGKQSVAVLLLDGGADVNVQNYVGDPPLQWSIAKNKGAVADVMRARGAVMPGSDCAREPIVGPRGQEGFRTVCR